MYVKFTVELTTKAQKGEDRYSSTLFLTSALNGVDGQRHSLAEFTPREKDPVPILQEAV
jgi:hypothetical protein